MISENTRLGSGEILKNAQLFRITWRNSGQSPAISASAVINIKIVPSGAEFEEFESEHVMGNSTIPAGGTFHTAHSIVPPIQFSAFQFGAADATVFSRLDYSHGLSPTNSSYSDITFRIRRDGVIKNEDNGKESPRDDAQVEKSKIGDN